MAASLPSVRQTRLGLPKTFLHLPPQRPRRLPPEIPLLRKADPGEDPKGVGRGEVVVARRVRVDIVGALLVIAVIW